MSMWARVAASVAAVVVAVAVGASAYFLVRPPTTQSPVAAAPTHQAVTTPSASPTKTPRVRPKPRQRTQPVPQSTATPVPQSSAPVATPPSTLAEQRLVNRLSRVVTRDAGGRLSLAVLDARGQLLFSHAAATPVLPASTQKLTVAGAALAALGPSHRYTTTVTADTQPAGGVLRGDLVIVGGGDPALAQPLFAAVEPDRPRTPLERLAGQIKRAGVRRITGRVIADPHVFAFQPIAAGWPPRYFDSLDATRITGLTTDAGRRLFESGGGLQARAADDPAKQTAVVLRRLLIKRGVKVSGGSRIAPRATAKPVTLASIASPPLDELLRYMIQRSDNHLADTIFRSLGAAAGDSTWVGAASATAAALAPLRLDWSGVVLADGSGLSRSNRVSAQFLAQLHASMWNSNLHDQWVQLLAVSGRSGTLRSRLNGAVSAGRLYGKTGSLRDVVSLVGTVVGSDSRLVHLAVVGNDVQSSSQFRAITDRAVLAAAEELQDCRRVRPPPIREKGKKPKPQPVRLVCG